jgi:hypothetical protein
MFQSASIMEKPFAYNDTIPKKSKKNYTVTGRILNAFRFQIMNERKKTHTKNEFRVFES